MVEAELRGRIRVLVPISRFFVRFHQNPIQLHGWYWLVSYE